MINLEKVTSNPPTAPQVEYLSFLKLPAAYFSNQRIQIH